MPPHFWGIGMSSAKRREKDPTQPPQPPRWKGADALELVYKMNERAFTLLKEGAMQNRDLWSDLDVQAIQRAARFPFVILDVCFTDELLWRSRSAANQRQPAARVGTLLWPEPLAEQLVGELLVFAWHTVKWDRQVARLSLGMMPGVVEAIAGLTPQQLTEVAAQFKSALRLRWQEDVEFWTRLLKAAAREGNEGTLADVHLHAKLLLLGELMTGSASIKVGA